jgi:translation elongation factor EF-Tu-like GTPase
MTSDLIKIKAKLTLYSTEKGGRQSGIKSGYRPNHVFEYKDNGLDLKAGYMGEISFDKNHIIKPSESKIVKVQFASGQNIDKYIELGRTWWIHEGRRKVGEAVITEIETE